MNAITRSLLLVGCAVVLGVPVFAQGPVPGGAGGLLRGITLDEQQRAQIETLRMEQQREMSQLWDDLRKGDTAAVRRRDELRARHLARVRDELEPGQRSQFDQNVAASRGAGQPFRGGPPGSAGTMAGPGGRAGGGAGFGASSPGGTGVPGGRGKQGGQGGQGGSR